MTLHSGSLFRFSMLGVRVFQIPPYLNIKDAADCPLNYGFFGGETARTPSCGFMSDQFRDCSRLRLQS